MRTITIGVDFAAKIRDKKAMGHVVHSDHLIAAVCHELTITIGDFRSTSRRARLVLARDLYAYIAHEKLGASFPQIAAGLRRVSHSAVHTGAARVAMELRSDALRPVGAESTLSVRYCVEEIEKRMHNIAWSDYQMRRS